MLQDIALKGFSLRQEGLLFVSSENRKSSTFERGYNGDTDWRSQEDEKIKDKGKETSGARGKDFKAKKELATQKVMINQLEDVNQSDKLALTSTNESLKDKFN
jgi:hypothetical protein